MKPPRVDRPAVWPVMLNKWFPRGRHAARAGGNEKAASRRPFCPARACQCTKSQIAMAQAIALPTRPGRIHQPGKNRAWRPIIAQRGIPGTHDELHHKRRLTSIKIIYSRVIAVASDSRKQPAAGRRRRGARKRCGPAYNLTIISSSVSQRVHLRVCLWCPGACGSMRAIHMVHPQFEQIGRSAGSGGSKFSMSDMPLSSPLSSQ